MPHTPPSRHPLSRVLPIGPLVTAALLAACGGNGGSGTGTGGTTSMSTGGSEGGSGGAGGTTVMASTPRELFEQTVLPGLNSECGACHGLNGPTDVAFIAPPDPYATIASWPGIIVKDPAKSILVNHPNEANHGGGQAPPISDELKAKALAWLKVEAANLPDSTGNLVYSVKPFKPVLGGGFSNIYLDEIDPSLQYASISFAARELDSNLLQLKLIEIHPIEQQVIHVVHPLFTVYPMTGDPDPDPIDSFAGIDQTFQLDVAETDLTLGTGELILTNWQKDAYLGIAFELIENEGGGGPPAGCKDVAKFKAEVVPQMQYCMMTCHGGAIEKAKATMDLSNLNAASPDEACAQVRARITPGDPPTSRIIQVTDPVGGAPHMYKFMGNTIKYKAFVDAVSPWIVSEGQQ